MTNRSRLRTERLLALGTAAAGRGCSLTTRRLAVVTLGGVVAALATFALFGVLPAGMVSLATLWFAASDPSVMGTSSPASGAGEVDPQEVRRYREDHPGTTIGEAAAAVARR